MNYLLLVDALNDALTLAHFYVIFLIEQAFSVQYTYNKCLRFKEMYVRLLKTQASL